MEPVDHAEIEVPLSEPLGPFEPIEGSLPIDRWRRTTVSGALAGALALGFQEVFDPKPVDTVGIEQEAPDRPLDLAQVELRFDPTSSSNTVVVVHRPDDA